MKKILLFAVLFLAVSVSSFAVGGKKKDNKKKTNGTEQPVKLLTSSDSTSYAAGYAATEGLLNYLTQRLNVDTAHLADFMRGFREAASKAKDPAYSAYIAGSTIAAQASGQILPNMSRDLVGTDDSIAAAPFYEGFIAGVKQDTTVFKMAKARDRFESKTTQARETRKPKPKATDEVEVIYEGKTINGKVFDATKNHGGRKTDSFRCDQVIKGWTEALTSMNVGSKWEIYIPQELAYGSREAGEIKPYSTLIFTVELVGIKTPETKPAADAKTTTDSKSTSVKAKTTTKSASKSNKKSTKKK